jgi:hypothetical protein
LKVDESSSAGREYHVTDRPWRPSDTERFIDSGADAVVMSFRRDTGRQITLDFLRDLPGLRRVDIQGPLKDDTPAFDVPDLEALGLYTGCARPLRLDRSPGLRILAVDDRPGLDEVGRLTNLASLTVARFKRTDVTFLGEHPSLELLRLEGRHGRVSLDGVGRCPALTEVAVYELSVDALEPLAALHQLRELYITPEPKTPPERPWNLEAVTGLPQLQWLKLGAPVQSLAPLRQAKHLVSVGFGSVVDGDLTPLLDLPPSVTVVVDDAPHHSHTVREIARLRGAA